MSVSDRIDRLRTMIFASLLTAVATRSLIAQPAAHPIGPVIATSPIRFSSVSHLVALSDGRVLVNDNVARIVHLLDPALAPTTIVLDSTGGARNLHPGTTRPFLLPFRGDSVLFFDSRAQAFLVIEPYGRLGRAITPPRVDGAPPSFGQNFPARATASALLFIAGGTIPPSAPRPLEGMIVQRFYDSLAVMRMDWDARRLDTAAFLSNGVTTIRTIRPTGSSITIQSAFLFPDRHVVTTDGSIAIVRGRDYRLDWIDAAGEKTVGSKLKYPWVKIPHEEKRRVADSANTRSRFRYDSILAIPRLPGAAVQTPPIEPRTWLPEDFPDFYPAFRHGEVLADGDNNVWVRPAALQPPAGGGSIWDVYNRASAHVDRVLIPEGKSIAGFARGGIVFLVSFDAGVARLEKSKAR